VLVFDREAFDTVAWVPEKRDSSRIQGLTPIGGSGYVLAEKGPCRFTIDTYGRLTGTVFSNQYATLYRYEGSRMTGMYDSFGGRVNLHYDRFGRVQRAEAEPGDFTAEYVYDNRMNELALVRYSDGRRLAMIYDVDGALAEVVCKTPSRETASHRKVTSPESGCLSDLTVENCGPETNLTRLSSLNETPTASEEMRCGATKGVGFESL
jgi:hypothetical protein